MNIPPFLYLCTCSREIIDIFPCLNKEKKLLLAFSWTPLKQRIFQTLHAYNLAWGQHCDGRFDDLCFKVTVVSENINDKLRVLDSCPL